MSIAVHFQACRRMLALGASTSGAVGAISHVAARRGASTAPAVATLHGALERKHERVKAAVDRGAAEAARAPVLSQADRRAMRDFKAVSMPELAHDKVPASGGFLSTLRMTE